MATRKTSTKRTAKASKKAAGKKKGAPRRAPARAQGAGLHALIGRAVADAAFLEQLLSAPERTLSQFNLDPATRRDVLALLSKPAAVRRNVSAFVRRFRRGATVEAV